jgi:hypothetical protein
MHVEFWLGNLKERRRLETYEDGKMILKSTCKYVLLSCGSGYGQVAGCCGHSHEICGSIKCGKID